MSKMFVHYSGTVEAFKAAKKDGKSFEEFYSNHIVFIKGGESGTGAAVYTHGEYFGDLAELQAKVNGLKYFSKISDGNNVATVANAEGTITIQGEDPAVTTKIDPTGIKIGLSNAFKTAVNTTLPGAISDVDAKLGAKDAVAASGSNATAFGRIKNLETIVAGLTGEEGGEVESVDAKINKAIEALDVNEISGDYIKSVKQVDGKIEATVGTFNFDAAGSAASALAEAKTYAEGQASAAQAAAIADAAGKYQVAGNYEEAGAAAAVQGNLDTEVLRAKAAEEANAAAIKAEKERMDAFMLSAEVGEAAVDTLKEIQSYITSDGTAAAKMAEDIATAQAAADAAQGEVDALEGVVAGVKATADAAATQIALDAEILRADAAEKANAAAIKVISDDYLKAADKTALEGQISAEATTARAAEEANAAAIKAISDDYLKGADKTELQGNINAKVAQSDYDTKVAELAGFWEWEEI